MLKGDLVVVGNAGKNFANYLIRGDVYIGGEWQSLGHNTRLEPLGDADLAKLTEPVRGLPDPRRSCPFQKDRRGIRKAVLPTRRKLWLLSAPFVSV